MPALGALLIIPVLVLLFAIRSFGYEPYRFPSASMMPTVQPGAFMLAQKFGYGHYGAFGVSILRGPITAEIKRGDIIVFDYPNDVSVRYAKRVIGLPGDVVKYRGRQVTINGQPVKTEVTDKLILAEANVKHEVLREGLSDKAYEVAYGDLEPSNDLSVTVPHGSYFVLGDNRDHSNDSRYWGFVPARNVVGKVVYVSR